MAIIAVDFDGTVVTHDFPRVGNDIGAVPVLKDLVKAGHKIVLFTMRSHGNPITQKGYGSIMDPDVLDDAVTWFKDNGIPLYGVNENPDQKSWTNSPKVYSHVIIDDTALGAPIINDPRLSERPFIDWTKVRELLVEQKFL